MKIKEPKTQGKIEEKIKKILSLSVMGNTEEDFDVVRIDQVKEDMVDLFKSEQNDLLQRVIELIGDEYDVTELIRKNRLFKVSQAVADQSEMQATIQNKLKRDLKTKISQMGEELKKSL